jgi:nitrite reductase/ring-hydroxylating ferredoxin subunit
MVIKSTDAEEKDSSPDDRALSGVSRFASMGGMFRGKKSDNDNDPDDEQEDEAGFLKNISRRLSFRRETEKEANGVQEPKKSSGFLRMMGIGKEPKSRDEAKSLAMLQKEKEINRKRQLILAEQKNRDNEKEKEMKLEEKRIAELIAKAEAEQKRDEARRQKEAAKLEMARQREEVKKQKEKAKLEAGKAKEEEGREKEEQRTPMSAAGKFFSNVWNTTTSAFGRGEEEWVPLIPKTRIEPGEIVPVQVQGIDLLVVASRDGKVHCLANSCSHMGTPLDTGRLESRPKRDPSGNGMLTTNSVNPRVECEDCIICPLHHTAFSLETGQVRGEWCPYPPVLGSVLGTVKKTAPVPTFDIRTRGKFIEVRLNSPV